MPGEESKHRAFWRIGFFAIIALAAVTRGDSSDEELAQIAPPSAQTSPPVVVSAAGSFATATVLASGVASAAGTHSRVKEKDGVRSSSTEPAT
mgnify:CR=1 FL=1